MEQSKHVIVALPIMCVPLLAALTLSGCAKHEQPQAVSQERRKAASSNAAVPSQTMAGARNESVGSDTPRILHLRDARFGIQFDPPDGSWLGIGPRTDGGGAQVLWIWSDGKRQIDVQALDLTISPGTPPSEAQFAEKMATSMRAKGSTVKIEQSTLAGAPCHHLVVSRTDGFLQDMFILHAANANYSMLVTQRVRDAGLLDKARKGFRLTTD